MMESIVATLAAWGLYEQAFTELMGTALGDVAAFGIGGHEGVDPRIARLAKHSLPDVPTWLYEYYELTGGRRLSVSASVLLAGWARMRISIQGSAGTRLRDVLPREAHASGHNDADLALRARLPNAALAAFLDWAPELGTTGEGGLLSRIVRDIEGCIERDSQGRPIIEGDDLDGIVALEEDFTTREEARFLIEDIRTRARLAPREAAWLDLYLQDMTET
jgi:hypothetical protein